MPDNSIYMNVFFIRAKKINLPFKAKLFYQNELTIYTHMKLSLLKNIETIGNLC